MRRKQTQAVKDYDDSARVRGLFGYVFRRQRPMIQT